MSVRRNRRSDECLPLKMRLVHLDRKAAERFPPLGILESEALFSLKLKKFPCLLDALHILSFFFFFSVFHLDLFISSTD